MRSQPFVAGLLCLLLAACGKGGGQTAGRVEGTVQLKGSPLSRGVVIFENPSKGVSASALVTEGRFHFDQPFDPGEFQVVVTPPPAPAPHEMSSETASPSVKIPEKYRNGSSSGLSAKVQSGVNDFQFTLE
ncbi:hypothetical protein SH661x_000381 [Planctomicrobium sp. SH661]|uniref:hypothetical protein n=1 Tax=Planctomicrobium sp. SH661 TaxID=3448124 RepID=UPI003F5B4889